MPIFLHHFTIFFLIKSCVLFTPTDKSKRHRRHKGKLTPLTYEDFTYQKKSPLYVIS